MNFNDLTPEQKAKAIEMMLQYRLNLSYPFACIWLSVEDIEYAINTMAYNPDTHFAFSIENDQLSVNMPQNIT